MRYKFVGIDEAFGDSTQTKDFHFFNPKFGFSYLPSAGVKLYASYSRGNREPGRDDFTENKYNSQPKSEQLNDIEYGIQHSFKNFAYGVNIYHMLYKNQLVLTGELNDVGNARRINVDKSSRNGLELEMNYRLRKWLNINGNLTLSNNKISNFDEVISNYDDVDGWDTIHHEKTDIAYSPNLIGACNFVFIPIKNLELTLVNKYVGKQYLDNTSNNNKKLNPYYVADLRLAYLFKTKSIQEIRFTLSVNNLFNKMYNSNGYTYGWIYQGTTYTYNHYYPQAGTALFAGVSMRF